VRNGKLIFPLYVLNFKLKFWNYLYDRFVNHQSDQIFMFYLISNYGWILLLEYMALNERGGGELFKRGF